MSFIKKIISEKGETIAETLIATLIAALSMVMFAGMVMASKTIVEESNTKIMDYYKGFSQLESKKEIGPISVCTYKNGVIYYEYGIAGSSEDSGDSDDSDEGT